MIDYKLILILVLSIVLLYLYNKVDSLKNDVTKLRKTHTEDIKKMEVLLINNNKINNIPIASNLNCVNDFCKMPSNNIINTNKNKEVFETVPEAASSKVIENLKLNVVNQETLVKERDTTDFSATENESDSESNMTSSENFVVYSNEKKISEQELNNNLADKYIDNINLDENSSLAELCNQNASVTNEEESVESDLTNELLNVTQEKSIDLEGSSKIHTFSDQNEEIIDVESLIDKLGAEPLVLENEFQLNGIELNNMPSSYLEIIDSSNSHGDESNQKAFSESNLEMLKVDTTSINSDLDYELSENDKDELNNTQINIKGPLQLDSFNTYKLYDLQQLAKQNNLTTTKVKNGKIRNKTKKELYNELNKINLKNN
jgi:hypothetical protein